MGFDGHTQTAYANAIFMNILQPEAQEKAGKWLTELIRGNGGKLSTGFLGVRPLLPALSATGQGDEAYKLLLNTTYPSWGYEVINGANTVWERWNSYVKGDGFTNNAGMNSFNHYAFGSVNEWLFGNAAGIKVVQPGFRTFIIKPEIASAGVNYVKASYHSVNGQIMSSWLRKGKQLELNISVPVNTHAEIFIPTGSEQGVMINKKPLKEFPWIKVKGYKDGFMVLEIGSGNYNFQSVL
jgi:alpha-L-rhamnosidase